MCRETHKYRCKVTANFREKQISVSLKHKKLYLLAQNVLSATFLAHDAVCFFESETLNFVARDTSNIIEYKLTMIDMGYISRFRNGKWLGMSNSMLHDKRAVLQVLRKLVQYINKGGLQQVRQDLVLLANYIHDVTKGTYKGYSTSALVLALAAIIYVVSPVDVLPDVIPFVGFVDDVSIVLWAISKLQEELSRYKKAARQTLTRLPDLVDDDLE